MALRFQQASVEDFLTIWEEDHSKQIDKKKKMGLNLHAVGIAVDLVQAFRVKIREAGEVQLSDYTSESLLESMFLVDSSIRVGEKLLVSRNDKTQAVFNLQGWLCGSQLLPILATDRRQVYVFVILIV